MPNNKSIKACRPKFSGYIIDRVKFEQYLATKVKSKIKLNTEVIDLKLKNRIWEVFTKTVETFKKGTHHF